MLKDIQTICDFYVLKNNAKKEEKKKISNGIQLIEYLLGCVIFEPVQYSNEVVSLLHNSQSTEFSICKWNFNEKPLLWK